MTITQRKLAEQLYRTHHIAYYGPIVKVTPWEETIEPIREVWETVAAEALTQTTPKAPARPRKTAVKAAPKPVDTSEPESPTESPEIPTT